MSDSTMLNDKQQYEIQELLKKKQIFIKKAITEIQKGNMDSAIKLINIDGGFNLEMTKIIGEAK